MPPDERRGEGAGGLDRPGGAGGASGGGRGEGTARVPGSEALSSGRPRPRVITDAPGGAAAERVAGERPAASATIEQERAEAAATRPRVILEEGAKTSPRLDFGWDNAVAPVALPGGRGWSSAGLVAAGVAVLLLGFSLLEAGNFIAAQFAQAAWLGWVTLAVAVGGFGLVFAAIWREVRGYLALGTVDRARAALARGDAAGLRAQLEAWQARLPPGRARAGGLDGAPIEVMAALVEAKTLAPIARDAAALGRAAAVQAFAITAVSPSPAADALIFVWRGLRLVRQVAALHGFRPGIAGTLVLLRRVAVDAATVAATDVAVDAAVRGLLSSRLVEHVAGEAAAGAVAARRMILLSRVADEACRVLPRR